MMPWTALGLGLFIGAQHAFEPDHLAALGTMLPDETSTRRAAARGAWWGCGHGLAIAVVGAPLILMDLRVPEHLEALGEFIVAVMLIALGAYAVWRALDTPSTTSQTHTPSVAKSTMPVGLIHGLAGSGAAIVLATTQAPSPTTALMFLAVFVCGSTLSMMGTAALLSLPLERFSDHPSRASWLVGLSGLVSILVGCLWGGPHLVGWLT